MEDVIDSDIISNRDSDLTSNSTNMQEKEMDYIVPTNLTNLMTDIVKSECMYFFNSIFMFLE